MSKDRDAQAHHGASIQVHMEQDTSAHGCGAAAHTGLVPSARVRTRTDSMRPMMSASVGCPVNTHAAYQRSGTACSVTAASLGAGALLASCRQNMECFLWIWERMKLPSLHCMEC